ncbi:MAG: DUF1232 domain-containing protein [Deltaproteobacteria bacterium]|nr:DUF1232 domain-containing protein [Deltaproteobacteria bacterium]
MSTSTSAAVTPAELVDRPRKNRWMSLPLVSDLGAMVRFFRDSEASTAGKVFVLLAIAYIVCPVDAIPDVAPLIGWLDDLGVAALTLMYLAKVLKPYKSADVTVQGEPVPSK